MDSEDIDFLISFGCLIIASCLGMGISGTIIYIVVQFVPLNNQIMNACILSMGIPLTLGFYFLIGFGVLPEVVDRWYAFKKEKRMVL